MKNVAKLFLLLAAPAALALAVAFYSENEEEAIQTVIERETAGYFEGDLDAWAGCLRHDERTVYVGSPLNGSRVLEGWTAINAGVGDQRRATPGAWKYNVRRDNWQIRRSGKTAFATFDQYLTFPDWPGVSKTKEIRCLEKTDGAWKITVLNWIDQTQLDNETQHAAVRALITAETDAFFRHDYDRWAACWAQKPGVSLTWNDEFRGVQQVLGFEQISATAREMFKEESTPFTLSQSNWSTEINGIIALAHYDQSFTDAQGKVFKAREFRVLYWDGAGWKMYQVNSFWDYSKHE